MLYQDNCNIAFPFKSIPVGKPRRHVFFHRGYNTTKQPLTFIAQRTFTYCLTIGQMMRMVASWILNAQPRRALKTETNINPYEPFRSSHSYQMDGSTFVLGTSGVLFQLNITLLLHIYVIVCNFHGCKNDNHVSDEKI